MDRREQLLSMFDASGFGLEIGPSYNPLLPKADGYNVETLHHADAATLRQKYKSNQTVEASRIEEVDYVSDGRPMSEVIGQTGRYDFIVASHVIEHTPDMLGFLQDCEALLKPTGVIALAVPDMRFCFDRYKPVTSLGEIIQAHAERRTRHTMACLFDHSAYFCEMDGAAGWSHDTEGEAKLKFDLSHAAKLANRHDGGEYIDSHAWQYTPSSFRLIIEDLHQMGEIRFREDAFAGSDIFEVFAVLSASGQGPGLSRQQMVTASLDEAASATAAYRELKATVAHLQSAPIDRTNEEALAERLRQAEERLQAALQRNAELEGSTSWKATGPLRALVSSLRR